VTAELERRIDRLAFQVNGQNGTDGIVQDLKAVTEAQKRTDQFIVELRTTLRVLKYLGGGIGVFEVVNFFLGLARQGGVAGG